MTPNAIKSKRKWSTCLCVGIFAELTQDMRMVFHGMSPQDISAIQK